MTGKPMTHEIEAALRAAMPVEQIEITDQSHLHAGHAGARTGGGHFVLHIVSSAFVGLPRIGRHRLVYDALAVLMAREIHALTIEARAPSEVS